MRMTRWIGGAFLDGAMAWFVAAPFRAQTAISFVAGPTFTSIAGNEVDDDEVDTKHGFFFAVGTTIPLEAC
jgi:hypothetical protein